MYTNKGIGEEASLSLKEQFLRDLEKNILFESFKHSEEEIRRNLLKKIEKDTLF